MKKLVFLTGSGVSADSGIRTFRDSGGLWENHRIEDVATPEAWRKDPGMVLDFYNERRKQVIAALPNKGHKAIADLEKHFSVQVITQNVDDLHERAGSTKVLHLHGEIRKARSTANPAVVVELEGGSLNTGDLCPFGSQLRPHIVWFGEAVPEIERAAFFVQQADIFVVAGTSLQVYPANGLVDYAKKNIPRFLVDPKAEEISTGHDFEMISATAEKGLPILAQKLIRDFAS